MDHENFSFEGQMLRKSEKTNDFGKKLILKIYTYRLVGKELYVFRKSDSNDHKSMHSLTGVFIRDAADEKFDETAVLFSFKLISPRKKVRQYYFTDIKQKLKWMAAIKQSIG